MGRLLLAVSKIISPATVLKKLFPAVTATDTDNPLIIENWTINKKLNNSKIVTCSGCLDNIIKYLP